MLLRRLASTASTAAPTAAAAAAFTTPTQFKASLAKQQTLAHLSASLLAAPSASFTAELCSLAFSRVGDICHEYNRPPPEARVLRKLVSVTAPLQNEFRTKPASTVISLVQGVARSGWVISGGGGDAGEEDEVDRLLLGVVSPQALRTYSLAELLSVQRAAGELRSVKPNELLHFRIAQAIKDSLFHGSSSSAVSSLADLSLLFFTFQHDGKTMRLLEEKIPSVVDAAESSSAAEWFRILHLLMERDVPVSAESLTAVSAHCLKEPGLQAVDTSMLFLVLAQLDRLQLVPQHPKLTREVLRELSQRGAPLFLGGWEPSKRYLRTLQRIRHYPGVLDGTELLFHPNFARVGIICGLSSFYVLFILDGGLLGMF